MALPAAPVPTDAELAAAITRGLATGDLIALTPEVLNAMAGGYGHAPDGCPVCATIPAHVVARNTL